MSEPVRAAVFASGGGTNLQALLDHEARRADCPYRVQMVVSDRDSAGALERARQAGRKVVVIPVSGRELEEVGRETLGVLEEAGIRMVCLAGYLRLIPATLVSAFPGRMLNIHPALLPGFGGKGMYGIHVHRAVLASGATFSGPTVHFVDEGYDTGGIVAQWPVPVHAQDTPEALAERVLAAEHLLYPACATALAQALRKEKVLEPLRLIDGAFLPGAWDSKGVEAALERGSPDN